MAADISFSCVASARVKWPVTRPSRMTVKSFVQDRGEMQRLLAVARGDAEADLVLRGGRLVNVFSGEIYPAEVAIVGGRVAGVSRDGGTYRGREVIDLDGEHIAPGFIDAHVHIESSLMLPAEYANAVMPHGGLPRTA